MAALPESVPEARVLVVDDETNIVELLSVSLKFQGFEVHTASNGPAALDKAREIAQRIARNGPLAVKGILATLRETEAMPEAEAFKIEMAHGGKVMASKDAAEGPRAFLEKRDPVFTGE